MKSNDFTLSGRIADQMSMTKKASWKGSRSQFKVHSSQEANRPLRKSVCERHTKCQLYPFIAATFCCTESDERPCRKWDRQREYVSLSFLSADMRALHRHASDAARTFGPIDKHTVTRAYESSRNQRPKCCALITIHRHFGFCLNFMRSDFHFPISWNQNAQLLVSAAPK